MYFKSLHILATLLTLTAGPALAGEPDMTAREATIPFANHGGVDDWRAVDDHTLLIKGLGKQWYRAELFSPCIDLRFTERIGFLVETDGSLSKWSGIVVRHEVCRFKSLTKTAPPDRKKK